MLYLVDHDAFAGDVVLAEGLQQTRALVNRHVCGDGGDHKLGHLQRSKQCTAGVCICKGLPSLNEASNIGRAAMARGYNHRHCARAPAKEHSLGTKPQDKDRREACVHRQLK